MIYQHDVPADWLKPGTLTTVEMRVHNPYIAPRDHARLGVLLRSAFFPRSIALSKVPPCTFEHRAKHRFGQFAGGGILLAGMVRADQHGWPGRFECSTLCAKANPDAPRDLAAVAQDAQVIIESHRPSATTTLRRQQIQLALQIGPAVGDLLARGLIVRAGRSATAR